MTSSELKFLENHRELLVRIFPSPIPEDIDRCDPNWHFPMEELNPEDAIEVAEFDSNTDGFATSWIGKCYYYVCSVPDATNTFVLFNIDQDDNWGVWGRGSLCAAEGIPSHSQASRILLNQFAIKMLEGEEQGEWRDFLEGLLDTI